MLKIVNERIAYLKKEMDSKTSQISQTFGHQLLRCNIALQERLEEKQKAESTLLEVLFDD
jgi:hypothetical protein